MSQDLFAAFGGEDSGKIWGSEPRRHFESAASKNASEQPRPSEDAVGWDQQNVVTNATTLDDDDDFGDFEDASVSNTALIEPTQGSQTAELNKYPASTLSKTATKSISPEAPPPSIKTSPSKAPEKHQNVGQHPFAGHMDLLFETGDDEYDAGVDELGDLSTNPEAAVAYSKRIIAEQEAAKVRPTRKESPEARPSIGANALPVSKTSNKASGNVPAKDPNVLFDADDLSEQDDEDEFDDFESGDVENAVASPSSETKQPQRTSMPAIDLLGLDDISENKDSVSRNGRLPGSLSAKSLSMEQPTSGSVNSAVPARPEDDLWDDFETAAPRDDQWSSDQVPSSSTIVKNRLETSKTLPKVQDRLPPTNVPPPAVLISVFPTLFAEADEALFNAIGKLDVKQKQMLLAHPASYQFLKGYLGHCIVLARIIAGRKSRWKRDQRLSQSMRIGPAGAGGKGGMKLTGLDKSEVAKEDREVLDVLRLWKNQVGKLRTAVTTASSAPSVPKLPPVPDIAEQMAIKTLRSSEGGITAPQPCALCGLKREERVAKVDVEVDDNFGEWWVQGMSMHLSCRNFWDELEKKLKSR